MTRLLINRTLFIMLAFFMMGCNRVNKSNESGNIATRSNMAKDSGSITPEEARKIAREAYIYGYPMIDGYRIQHAYFVEKDNTEYIGPFNILISAARVYTADDKVVQTPNSDTPYGMLGFDLRTEPIVLTVPAMEKNRYFSIQLIDGMERTGNLHPIHHPAYSACYRFLHHPL